MEPHHTPEQRRAEVLRIKRPGCVLVHCHGGCPHPEHARRYILCNEYCCRPLAVPLTALQTIWAMLVQEQDEKTLCVMTALAAALPNYQ